MKFKVAGVAFASKAALTRHCQALLKRHAHRKRVTGEDDTFLRSLMILHPRVREKVGCGVSHFSAQKMPPFFKYVGLMLHRTDGSSVDFSYLACIHGDTPWADYQKACRYAVADQVYSFRDAAFARGPVTCAVTGEDVDPEYCHVDHHIPTFLVLIRNFLGESRWEDVPLVEHPSGAGGYVFESDYAMRFADYHRKHAKLRVLTPRGNLSTQG